VTGRSDSPAVRTEAEPWYPVGFPVPVVSDDRRPLATRIAVFARPNLPFFALAAVVIAAHTPDLVVDDVFTLIVQNWALKGHGVILCWQSDLPLRDTAG
jgi:hypothetical protein